MPLSGTRIDGIDGRRSTHREPVLLAASVLNLERTHCAIIENVTSTEARLSGSADAEPGDCLWIKVGCLDRLATVAWFEDGHCGITFDAPLTHEDVIHLRCEARNTLVMRLTPEEQIAARDWIAVLAR